MKTINENNLLEIGFKKQYAHSEDGFYMLDVDDKFYFTVDFKTMTLSIQLKSYGHVQKIKHIKTIKQVTDLFFDLTGKQLYVTFKEYCESCKRKHIVTNKPCPSCGVYHTPPTRK